MNRDLTQSSESEPQVFAGTCRRQAFLFRCRQGSRGTDGSHHGDHGTPAEKGANLRDKMEEKASSGPVSQ